MFYFLFACSISYVSQKGFLCDSEIKRMVFSEMGKKALYSYSNIGTGV